MNVGILDVTWTSFKLSLNFLFSFCFSFCFWIWCFLLPYLLDHLCFLLYYLVYLLSFAVFFISVIIFLNFEWFIFVFYMFLFKFSLCWYILFPNSIIILITNVFNSWSGKFVYFCFITCFFRSFSCFFKWGQFSVFSLCLNSSVSMKFGETVTYCGLEGVSLSGSFPIQSACALWLWWETGFNMSTSHIFPLGLLAAATLVGSGTKMKHLEPGVNWGFSLCQVWAGFVPFMCKLSLLPTLATWPQR